MGISAFLSSDTSALDKFIESKLKEHGHSLDEKNKLNVNLNPSKDDIINKEYLVKSNNKIIDEIYSSYDLSLNKKYKVKVFQNTLDRIKNNFE